MADASIIDIGGVQWNVKDKEARNGIEDINTQLTPQILSNIPISIKSGYSAKKAEIRNVMKYGKLYSGLVWIENIRGSNIGSNSPSHIGKISNTPFVVTNAIGINYYSGSICRFEIDTVGNFTIQESPNTDNGSNTLTGQIYWIEA